MPRSPLLPLLIGFILLGTGCDEASSPHEVPTAQFAGKKLVLFVGSASQRPVEAAAQAFERRTGARLEVHFGGSGEMLARMKLAEQGDIYFPGSSDYMELAKREGLIDPSSQVTVAYLVPAINVPRDNPRGIKRLQDLARPGVRVAIAQPDTVCVGLYAAEVLERAGLAAQVRPNIVSHAESCAKVAQLVALGQVDAAIGWDVFQQWEPEKIITIPLPRESVPRIGVLPAAIVNTSREVDLAKAFLGFLTSPDGQAIFARWNYLTSEQQARAHAMPGAPVGGEWALPAGW